MPAKYSVVITRHYKAFQESPYKSPIMVALSSSLMIDIHRTMWRFATILVMLTRVRLVNARFSCRYVQRNIFMFQVRTISLNYNIRLYFFAQINCFVHCCDQHIYIERYRLNQALNTKHRSSSKKSNNRPQLRNKIRQKSRSHENKTIVKRVQQTGTEPAAHGPHPLEVTFIP